MSSFMQGEIVGFFHGQPVAVTVKYFPNQDPYALVFIFFTPEPVQWTFARDLLMTGLSEQAGVGDVKFRPEDDAVVMSISDGTQMAEFHFRRPDVETIVRMTTELMPPGDETSQIDWDTELTELLKE